MNNYFIDPCECMGVLVGTELLIREFVSPMDFKLHKNEMSEQVRGNFV